MIKYSILLVVSLLVLLCGSASYGQMASSTDGINGNKNPEKIPTHVAAFMWFSLAATNMNDAKHPYRFDQDLGNTGLSQADQGVLKAIVSNFYEAYAKLLAAYNTKVSLRQVTSDDTHAFNKAKFLLALDALAQTKQQMSSERAKRFAAYIEGSKRTISMTPSAGSEVSQ
jgi:hypothetical protein